MSATSTWCGPQPSTNYSSNRMQANSHSPRTATPAPLKHAPKSRSSHNSSTRQSYQRCAAQASPQERDAASLDIRGAVVNPSFRTTPETSSIQDQRISVNVLFVSESGVCRAALASAAFTQLIDEAGLAGEVACQGAASRDYNAGEPVDGNVALVAAEMELPLDAGYRVRKFEESKDITIFDMICVMDKFTAADVLREISVFDTIDPQAKYSSKVRRLGEFNTAAAAAAPNSSDSSDKDDIDDPLYGNIGGDEELEAVRASARVIRESCKGLVEYLVGVRRDGKGESFRDKVSESLKELQGIEWLVPPMLQKR